MQIRFVKILCTILLAILIYSSSCIASDQQSLEYRVKALLIVRLALFISWPEDSQKTTFKICIDSTDPVANEFQFTEVTELKGRTLEVIDPPRDESIRQCDFLYLSAGPVDRAIAKFPVVTISSQAGFAEQGGMIEFYIDDSKVRMKTNLHAVHDAHIKLSSKLIRLLHIVDPLSKNLARYYVQHG